VVANAFNRWRRLRRVAGLWLVAAAALAIMPASALGAGQGSIAAQTQGTIFISLQSTGLVRISKLTDINLGSWSGGALNGGDPLCVFSSTWGYTLSASSTHGTGTAFRMTDGAGNFITYNVTWRDSFNRLFNLQHGANTPFLWAIAFSTTCNFLGNNARVDVQVPSANISGKPAGTYSDTLTFVVAPQ